MVTLSIICLGSLSVLSSESKLWSCPWSTVVRSRRVEFVCSFGQQQVCQEQLVPGATLEKEKSSRTSTLQLTGGLQLHFPDPQTAFLMPSAGSWSLHLAPAPATPASELPAVAAGSGDGKKFSFSPFQTGILGAFDSLATITVRRAMHKGGRRKLAISNILVRIKKSCHFEIPFFKNLSRG